MPRPRIRTVPTGSGATAVQIIWGYKNRKPIIDHIGSAHDADELAVLTNAANRIIHGDQLSLDFSTTGSRMEMTPPATDPVPITDERAGYLIDAVRCAYDSLGFDQATGGDEVFFQLVLARIIHPGSKLDSIETLAEVGITSASYRTIMRRLPTYATATFKQQLTQACATHAGLGPGMLVLYDVTTLYFETDRADEFRKPGFSKERRLEPQITVGLLTDVDGFPLAVEAFEGNKAETTTMLPVIRHFQQRFHVDDVTVVADAGMFSESNKKALRQAGLDYILGVRITDVPYPVLVWRKQHPGQDYADGQVWVHANRAGRGADGVPHSVTFYQYRWDRARRTLRGIDEQITKAERAVAGQLAVKRNRYVDLKAPDKQVNYQLADTHRAVAGIKGYETSRVDMDAETVIAAYRRLLLIEKAFRMSKSDLKARPIYHHRRESIEAHMSVVVAAMAVGHVLEQRAGMSLRRVVRTLRKYRSFSLIVGGQRVQAASPLPDEVAGLVSKLMGPGGV